MPKPIKITRTPSKGSVPKTSSVPLLTEETPIHSDCPWSWVLKHKGTITVTPKSVQTGTRWGKGRFYNDKGKSDYMRNIIEEAAHLAPPAPIESPVLIELKFVIERPTGVALKSTPRWIKELLKRYAEEFPAPTRGGPDIDNLQKGLVDGLVKSGFFYDDGYIVSANPSKYFVADEARGMIAAPRVEFEIFTPDAVWENSIKPFRK